MSRRIFLVLALLAAPFSAHSSDIPPCPPDDPAGDITLSTEVVRLVLSWGRPSCSAQKQFPLLQTPRGPLELDHARPSVRLTSDSKTRILNVRRIGRNQVQVQFEVNGPGMPVTSDELIFLRHTHSRVQNQMGCATVLRHPKHAYTPNAELCPTAPAPPKK
jgi:hypothetical protein